MEGHPPPGRVGRFLEHLLHTHDTPKRTAAAFAVGVFFGFSPFLGLHTVLGLIFAFAFGLNRVAVLLGIYSNLPWILPAYYTLTTLAGAALLGTEIPPGALSRLSDVLQAGEWREVPRAAGELTPLVWAYAIGSTLGAIALAVVAYQVSLAAILAHRRHAAHRHRDDHHG